MSGKTIWCIVLAIIVIGVIAYFVWPSASTTPGTATTVGQGTTQSGAAATTASGTGTIGTTGTGSTDDSDANLDAQMSQVNSNMTGLNSDISQTDNAEATNDTSDQ